ncbi:MAG: hypothetical protein WC389_20525 [Lutibacter sp.]|jgi:hypothetical protein
MNKENLILEIMNRLNLPQNCNGLLTYAVLEELYNGAYEAGHQEGFDECYEIFQRQSI